MLASGQNIKLQCMFCFLSYNDTILYVRHYLNLYQGKNMNENVTSLFCKIVVNIKQQKFIKHEVIFRIALDYYGYEIPTY